MYSACRELFVELLVVSFFVERSILKRLSEAIPPFDIQYSIFCGSAVRF